MHSLVNQPLGFQTRAVKTRHFMAMLEQAIERMRRVFKA